MPVAGSSVAGAGFFDGMDRAIDLICKFPVMRVLSRMVELVKRGHCATPFGSYVMLRAFSGDAVYVEHASTSAKTARI